ncbi:uncharacterized protein si:ch211-214p13.8 isoform X3 [Pimephales promelas]|uniref:uncharacterized protein si:ch211-214p13.8 isoform X3 n=1 Tax=Pimephales promelas TaxID=90988 RepID=UPI001955683A|nr:uncharacterized protein si:ch211-214p13.8 isoform X3 [Pimephales promelas]
MDCLYLRKKALFLDVFVVFILHMNTDTQGLASQCPVFRVPRGAVHKVCTNKPFKISCNLKNCRGQTNNITWTKETLKGWIPVSGGQMSSSQIYSASDLLTSYLTFTNISKNHDGHYRCELLLSNSSTVSHYINISVSVSSTDDSLGDEMSCTERGDNSETNYTDIRFNSNPWWLPYLFICMAVVIPILILMLIFILCIKGCKTLRRKKTEKAKVQYAALLKCDEFVCVQYTEETLTTTHPSLPPELSTLLNMHL